MISENEYKAAATLLGVVASRTGTGRLLVTYRTEAGRSNYVAVDEALNPSYVISDPAGVVTIRTIQEADELDVWVIEEGVETLLGEVPITAEMFGATPYAAGLALGRGEAVSVNVPLIIHRRAQ